MRLDIWLEKEAKRGPPGTWVKKRKVLSFDFLPGFVSLVFISPFIPFTNLGHPSCLHTLLLATDSPFWPICMSVELVDDTSATLLF